MNKEWKYKKMLTWQSGELHVTHHSVFKKIMTHMVGKEYDEMNGLNWSNFIARFYSGIIPTFPTMDPLAEKDYSVSPYAYCRNNPLRYTDPYGMSTQTDSLGNVVAVYNDNDNHVYRHNELPCSYATYEGETETYTDADGNAQTREKNRLSGGENMGETEYWDEFRVHDDKTGTILNNVEGRIAFSESWDLTIRMSNENANQYDLSTVAILSLPNEQYDIKNSPTARYGITTGKLLNLKSASKKFGLLRFRLNRLIGKKQA